MTKFTISGGSKNKDTVADIHYYIKLKKMLQLTVCFYTSCDKIC